MEPTKSLFSDWEFRKDLERRIANAVCDAITAKLPVSVPEASWICKAHAVDHVFDAHRCGQDMRDSRIKLFTDGLNTVTRMHIG